jgi:hypothetical protein
MRAIRSVTLWLGLGLLVVAGAAGCKEGVCDPCPANPDGDPLCNGAEGSYYGELTGKSGTCADASVLDGNIRVDVTGIVAGVDADDEPVTLIEVTLTDENGNNSRFQGTICDNTQDKAPFLYYFMVTYEESMAVEGFQISNRITGNFYDENGDSVPESIDATYSVNFVDLNNAENTCSMQASLRTTPDE